MSVLKLYGKNTVIACISIYLFLLLLTLFLITYLYYPLRIGASKTPLQQNPE